MESVLELGRKFKLSTFYVTMYIDAKPDFFKLTRKLKEYHRNGHNTHWISKRYLMGTKTLLPESVNFVSIPNFDLCNLDFLLTII